MELALYFFCVVLATLISVWIDENFFPYGYFVNPFKKRQRFFADESRKIELHKKIKPTRK